MRKAVCLVALVGLMFCGSLAAQPTWRGGLATACAAASIRWSA